MADRTRPGFREKALGALSWLWASCEKVSRSESESLDRERSAAESLMVNAHQIACPSCRRFRRQVRLLEAALARIRERGEVGDRLPGLFFPPDVRERIKTELRAAKEPTDSVYPGSPTD
jgi:predicted anti-sigma-YlaC factor YlaD